VYCVPVSVTVDLATVINEQDVKGFWTKVHEIFSRRRGIIVYVNATIGVAIFPFPFVRKCQHKQHTRGMQTCRRLAPQNWLPWQRPVTEVHQILSRSNFSSTVLRLLTQQSALRSVHLLSNDKCDIKKESNICKT